MRLYTGKKLVHQVITEQTGRESGVSFGQEIATSEGQEPYLRWNSVGGFEDVQHFPDLKKKKGTFHPVLFYVGAQTVFSVYHGLHKYSPQI